MPVNFGGPGVTPSLGALISTEVSLQSGAVFQIPSGRWSCKPGIYSVFQEFDPVTGIFRSIGGGPTDGFLETFFSDGANYRIANQTGCVVGAAVTTAGSGYTTTSPPTWTVGAGGAIMKSVIGGSINTSVTVVAGGTNYTYPPLIIFSAPPVGGVPATAHCTLSGGAVNSITVDDQGGGYTVAPTITIQNDPRELNPAAASVTQGSGAVATCTLTGAGTLVAVLCLDHGQGGQSAVPSLTISSGSGAATAIMCWTLNAYVMSTTTAGSGYNGPIIISGYDTPPSQTANTNPTISSKLVRTRNAFIVGVATGAAISATGQVVKDAGVYTAAPTMYVQSTGVFGAGPVQAVFLAATMGGQTDVSFICQT